MAKNKISIEEDYLNDCFDIQLGLQCLIKLHADSCRDFGVNYIGIDWVKISILLHTYKLIDLKHKEFILYGIKIEKL